MKIKKWRLKLFRSIKIVPILILFIAFSFLFAGCRSEQEDTDISFETISKDFYSLLEEETKVAINDGDSFRDLLNSAGIDIQEAVDFDQSMVIAVFMGQRSTGGYDIEIKRIVDRNDQVIVYYETTEPSEDDMLAQVITSPYHIVKIDLSGKEIVFEKM
jgi:hypothetical protein